MNVQYPSNWSCCYCYWSLFSSVVFLLDETTPAGFWCFWWFLHENKAALAASLPEQLYRRASQFSNRFWILCPLRLEIGTTGANLSLKRFDCDFVNFLSTIKSHIWHSISVKAKNDTKLTTNMILNPLDSSSDRTVVNLPLYQVPADPV